MMYATCNKFPCILTLSSFYYLTNTAKLRDLMSKTDLENVIHAFISTRVDYY